MPESVQDLAREVLPAASLAGGTANILRDALS